MATVSATTTRCRCGAGRSAAHPGGQRDRDGGGVGLVGIGVDFVEGFEYDNGYLSPYLVTHPASLEAILDDPYILLCSEKITKVQQLMPLLDKVMRAPKPLVIIAETVEGSALSMLVHNHVNGMFQSVATKAPGFGDRRLRKLEDIATITVARSTAARRIQPRDDDDRAARSRPSGAGQRGSYDDHRRRGDGRSVAFRVSSCVPNWSARPSASTKRCSANASGPCRQGSVIKVGAPTNAELAELQHRVEDALSATRAAMAEGIVAGGGVALMHAASALDDLDVKDDYATGVEIVRRSLTEPTYLIAANAGYNGHEVVAEVAKLGADEGFDALEGRYGNMIDFGIIVHFRVCRSALQNGAAVAGLLLTTNT